MTKKITMATMKSFIRKNTGKGLFLNVKSSFDGMQDCCESRNYGFLRAMREENHISNTLGMHGMWLVGGSRDYFNKYEDSRFIGIEYSNSCGRGIVAIEK